MEIVRYDEHPDLLEAYRAALGQTWPAFIFHDPISNEFHVRATRMFGAFDLLLRDGPAVLAAAWAVPMAWDGSLEDLPDGFDGALVRSTSKHRYPLQSMEEYASWRREDGTSVDAWIRTHEHMGARILGVARRSMVVPGTVAEWEGDRPRVPDVGRLRRPGGARTRARRLRAGPHHVRRGQPLDAAPLIPRESVAGTQIRISHSPVSASGVIVFE